MPSTKVYKAVPAQEDDVESVKATAEPVVEAKVVSTEQNCCRRNRATIVLAVLGALGLLFLVHQLFCRHNGSGGAWMESKRVSSTTTTPSLLHFVGRFFSRVNAAFFSLTFISFSVLIEPRDDDGSW